MDAGMMMFGSGGFGGGDFATSGAGNATYYDPSGGPNSAPAPSGRGSGAGGGGMGGFGQLMSGMFQGMMAQSEASAQAALHNAQAQILDQKAAQERAAGQRRALERARQTREVISKQVALAAASGGGAYGTPSLLDIIGDTEQKGEYMRLGDMFEGWDKGNDRINEANMARYQASVAKMKGQNAMLGSMLSAFGGFAKSANRSSFYG